jgi:hypothetical protein
MRTFLVLVLLLTPRISLAVETLIGDGATSPKLKIASIEEKYASPSFYEYLGYPVCKEILDRRAAEDAERRTINEKFGLKPLKKISGGKAEEEFEKTHQVSKPVDKNVCFASNTKIQVLEKRSLAEGGDQVIETEISKIQKDDFVLGSTADQAREDRYKVRACWTRVTADPYEGAIPKNGRYLTITFGREKNISKDRETLSVTPGHRIRATYWGGRMLWIDAKNLVRGYRIFGADGTFVLESKPHAVKVHEGKLEVTNLQTETGNYFVGKKGSEILAHNEEICM